MNCGHSGSTGMNCGHAIPMGMSGWLLLQTTNYYERLYSVPAKADSEPARAHSTRHYAQDYDEIDQDQVRNLKDACRHLEAARQPLGGKRDET